MSLAVLLHNVLDPCDSQSLMLDDDLATSESLLELCEKRDSMVEKEVSEEFEEKIHEWG
jgi:hypothetical protein